MSTSIIPLIFTAANMGADTYHLWRTPLTPVHQINFRWQNQRQIRKNRRRAHAAGYKKAFNK